MFSFLNTAALFGLAAAALPLVIHLLSRRRVKTVDFSSLMFLKSIQRSRLRWLRLREILLLLLRTLIIALIALSFARPVLKTGAVPPDAGCSAIVALDGSLSMRRHGAEGNVFEIARSRALSLLDLFSAGDEAAAFTFGKQAWADEAGFFTDLSVPRRVLQQAQPTFETTDAAAMIEAASGLITGAGNFNRELYIVSDFSGTGWGTVNPDLIENAGLRVFLLPVESEVSDQCGVTTIQAVTTILRPQENFDMRATVRNYMAAPVKGKVVSLFVDGERVAEKSIDIGAGESQPVSMRCRLPGPGPHHGKVTIEDDDFGADDARYFTFQIPAELRVALLGGDESSVRAVEFALNPKDSRRPRFQLVRVRSPRGSGGGLATAGQRGEGVQAVVLLAPFELNGSDMEWLDGFVRAGGGLLVAAGGSSQGTTGRGDGSFGPAETLQHFGIGTGRTASPGGPARGYDRWTDFNLEHAILSPYRRNPTSPRDLAIPALKLYERTPIVPPSGAAVLGRTDNGSPVLVEVQIGDGKMLALGTGFSPGESDIASHTFFVPFLQRSVEYLCGNAAELDLGSALFTPLEVVLPPKSGRETTVILPDSTERRASMEIVAGTRRARITDVNLPGIYAFLDGGEVVAYRAVNVGDPEPELFPDKPERLAGIFGEDRTTVLDPAKSIPDQVTESRSGTELWQELLLAALMLLAVEMVLARTGGPTADAGEQPAIRSS